MNEDTNLGRPTGEAAKRAIVERLLTVWLANPDLRLGQLIGNVVDDEKRLYFIGNDALLGELEAVYLRRERKRPSGGGQD